MRFKTLGRSGLRVSELCLGTMTFGETWGWGADKATSRAMFDLFTDRGGNFIDTSVNYTDGTSEDFIGEFIQGRRDKYVIATKYTLTQPDSTDPNSGGNSRKNMRQSLQRSLQRLHTDYVDILYLHMWDYLTPVPEVMRGLDDLVRSGMVHYLAISDTPAYIVAEANTLADLRGWSSFLGYQVPYNLQRRDIEREIIPAAAHWGMTLLPWGLLRAGILTGKFLAATNEATRLNAAEVGESQSEQDIATVRAVLRIAEETGKSPAQVAINWARQHPGIDVIPIIGARKLHQLEDNLAVTDWRLSDEHWQQLDEVSAYRKEFPHNFLPGNRYVFGATHDLIDR